MYAIAYEQRINFWIMGYLAKTSCAAAGRVRWITEAQISAVLMTYKILIPISNESDQGEWRPRRIFTWKCDGRECRCFALSECIKCFAVLMIEASESALDGLFWEGLAAFAESAHEVI